MNGEVLDGLDAPSPEKIQRAITDRARVERQRVIREYGLSGEEVARASTMTPGDPVSNYMGNLEIQAQIIVDERDASKGPIRQQFDRVVEGFKGLIGKEA